MKPGIEINQEDLFIWEAYSFCCVLHPGEYAVCLHESPPKSRNPKWKEEPWTRFPVCNYCHTLLHEMPLKESMKLLIEKVDLNYPDVLRRLKNGRSKLQSNDS